MPYNIALKGMVTTLTSYVAPSSYYRTLASLFSENDKVKRHFNFFLHPPFSNLRKAPVYHNPIWAMENVFNISNRNDLTAIMDIKTYLPDAMLYKVDRASMAASLEVRVPYLDNEVVDFALRLPFQFKSNSIFSHKAVLKSLLTQLAPHYNVNKPKKGFNFPLDTWLRKNWKEKALSIISKQALENIGLDGQEYMEIVLNYYNGNKRNSTAVWYLLNLLLWKQKHDQTTSLKNETLSHYNY
jgi:asparagine synthase (glutamine-hydrolysing)